jgi:alanine dehydrogenase
VHFTRDETVVAGVARGPSYPVAPPMVWSPSSSTPAFPAWPVAAGGDTLATAVTDLLAATEPDPGVIRAGIEERLSVHLPRRVDARVLLIGAGSVGSNAAEMLVRSGVREFTIVDFDVVEPANLSRTVYDSAALGRAPRPMRWPSG